jgi:hypothetical protein
MFFSLFRLVSMVMVGLRGSRLGRSFLHGLWSRRGGRSLVPMGLFNRLWGDVARMTAVVGRSDQGIIGRAPDLVGRLASVDSAGGVLEGGYIQRWRHRRARVGRVGRRTGLLGVRSEWCAEGGQQDAIDGGRELDVHCQSSKSETGMRRGAHMFKTHEGCRIGLRTQRLFRSDGFIAGEVAAGRPG